MNDRITALLDRLMGREDSPQDMVEIQTFLADEEREREAARRFWVFDVLGTDGKRTGYTSPFLGDALGHQVKGGSITPRRVNAQQLSYIQRKLA